MRVAFTTFETPIGLCAIAWRGEAIVQVVLPAEPADEVGRRIRRRHPESTLETPPPFVADAIQAMQAHLGGSAVDLTSIPVDVGTGSPFEQEVWALTRAIPTGATRTYGDLARALGDVARSREVGQALGRNPVPIIVPCHRVVASDGGMGGFSAPGGTDTKRRLLVIERAPAVAQGSLFDH